MNKMYLHNTWRILRSIAFVFYIAIPLAFRFLEAFFPFRREWTAVVSIADGAEWYPLSENIGFYLGATHAPTAL